MPHTFLSDDWLAEAKKIADEAGGGGFPGDIQLNFTVTGGPEGDKELHVANGVFAAGHVEAPTKLTVPFSVAKDMFVNGNQQAGMQAFMSGQIKVEGDMTKLMAMQSSAPDPTALEVAARIKEITE